MTDLAPLLHRALKAMYDSPGPDYHVEKCLNRQSTLENALDLFKHRQLDYASYSSATRKTLVRHSNKRITGHGKMRGTHPSSDNIRTPAASGFIHVLHGLKIEEPSIGQWFISTSKSVDFPYILAQGRHRIWPHGRTFEHGSTYNARELEQRFVRRLALTCSGGSIRQT